MRQETIVQDIYQFHELDPKVQQRVLDDHRLWNVQDTNWWEPTITAWQDKLEVLGFVSPTIYFNGFYSQGDGACFEAECDPELLITFLNARKYRRLVTLHQTGELSIRIRRNTYANRYSHERSRYVLVSCSACEKHHPRLTALCMDLQNEVETLRHNLSTQIYTDLQTEYEFLTSDDTIRASLKDSEVEFYSNGVRY